MRVDLKPIGEQVIVITGASSGIGLATAEMAARPGARVVLAYRGRTLLGLAVVGATVALLGRVGVFGGD
jgi:NAD(P)-dependent dehydrogenase (short-subunit alcohol dehydrogenase family)